MSQITGKLSAAIEAAEIVEAVGCRIQEVRVHRDGISILIDRPSDRLILPHGYFERPVGFCGPRVCYARIGDASVEWIEPAGPAPDYPAAREDQAPNSAWATDRAES